MTWRITLLTSALVVRHVYLTHGRSRKLNKRATGYGPSTSKVLTSFFPNLPHHPWRPTFAIPESSSFTPGQLKVPVPTVADPLGSQVNVPVPTVADPLGSHVPVLVPTVADPLGQATNCL